MIFRTVPEKYTCLLYFDLKYVNEVTGARLFVSEALLTPPASSKFTHKTFGMKLSSL